MGVRLFIFLEKKLFEGKPSRFLIRKEDEMKRIDNQIKTFDVGDGYFVDICTSDFTDTYAAYIYHKDSGVKIRMFEIERRNVSRRMFLNFVRNALNDYKNVIVPGYIPVDED